MDDQQVLTGVVRDAVRQTARSRFTITLAALLCLPAGTVVAAGGSVRIDSTLGPAATLTGPTYNITQSLGKASGNNLFFSFQYFSVGTGETALFSTTTPTIANVISRVTGGAPSLIDGTIRLAAAAGTPDFFLINPSGVTFSANATVDVPAAFHVTTASYLKFPDGNFYADPTRASTLSAAAPEAFGFLGQSRATVAVEGPSLDAGNGGGAFDVVAGDVSLVGNGSNSSVAGIVTTTGGIRVAAVGAQTGEAPLTGSFASNEGTVSLMSGAQLAAGTPDPTQRAAGIEVVAGTLNVDGTGSPMLTGIMSLGGGLGADPIDVRVGGKATLAAGGGFESQAQQYPHAGADINLTADTLTIQGTGQAAGPAFTGIETFAPASGPGGGINVSVNALTIDGANPTSTQFVGMRTFTIGALGAAGGDLTVLVTGAANVVDGGELFAATTGSGKAGDVSIGATSLTINGEGTTTDTGIASDALAGTSGAAGLVAVSSGTVSVDHGLVASNTLGSGDAGGVGITATGDVTISNGAFVGSQTLAGGNAGVVEVKAGSLTIDGGSSTVFTGITSSAEPGSTGAAGLVDVQTPGALSLVHGGDISTDTLSSGAAGAVTIEAGSVTVDGMNSTRNTAISSSIEAGSTGALGAVFVTASGPVTVVNGGYIESSTAGTGNAGGVVVSTPGAVKISDGGIIGSFTSAAGDGGLVEVDAGSISIDAGPSSPLTGISTDAEPASGGAAGLIEIKNAGALSVAHGGSITSNAFSSGAAGAVQIQTGSLTIDGSNTDPSVFTGISSSADFNTTGNAGAVVVTASGAVDIVHGGLIQSVTRGAGNAGQVDVYADSVTIAKQSALTFTGLSSDTDGTAAANAGGVLVVANSLSIDGSGSPLANGIASNSGFNSGTGGNAGTIGVQVKGTITLSNGGSISSGTVTQGKGGDITIQAGTINGSNNAEIATDTFGPGAGGSVTVTANSLNLALGTIDADAEVSSGGQPGTILIGADDINLTRSAISIENDATVSNPSAITPTLIRIDGSSILLNNSTITASSTGNADASSIEINYAHALTLDPSLIQTVANTGNGGTLTITGQGPLLLNHSSINTSVFGTTVGNGGNIHIDAPYLILDSGVIAANTNAPQANGGDVTIDALALIPSFKSYLQGGSNTVAFDPTLAGLNVVQAAAPDGVSGTLNVTVPSLDLGNALVSLPGAPAAPPPLGRSVCRFTQGSTLAVAGRGGLPPSGSDPLWFDSQDAEPLTADGDVHVAALVMPVCR